MITVVTPTGGRPEALARLATYVNAQTVREFKWIMCDDCDPASQVPQMRDGITVEVIRPQWRWEGQNTHARSLIELLKTCEGPVIHCEDDDVYLPDHIATMLQALRTADLVGQRVSHYWNAATRRYRAIPGTYHASLGASAMQGPATILLRMICGQQQTRLDIDLWRSFSGRKSLLDTTTAVGIKGLPGRAGIGVGHRENFGEPDPDGRMLKALIGHCAASYL
ncbi:glycosyltransferase [Panacagrimonas sp.]|uniref:glycosyltransferase n=1 Tax=Panacagrimonas sp. TaxID=2480088 RepID=UPI003B51EA34